MNLISRLNRHYGTPKRYKKAKKAIFIFKGRIKGQGHNGMKFLYFLASMGSLGPTTMENVFNLNSETRKAARRPLDSRIGKLLLWW